MNTSLVRECLELILMLADALEKKKAGLPITQNSLPATPRLRLFSLWLWTGWKQFAIKQLGDVGSDAPGLVKGERFAYVYAPARLLRVDFE